MLTKPFNPPSRSAWAKWFGAALVTWIILKITDALIGNRVSDEEETEGLDLVSHNERGYNL